MRVAAVIWFCAAVILVAAQSRDDAGEFKKTADALLAQGKFENAREIYDLILAMAPNHALVPDVLQNKALALQAQGQWDKSEAVFREALKRFPQRQSQWLYHIACVLGFQSRYAEAYAVFNRMLKETPKDPLVPNIYYQTGLFKMNQQLFLEALEAFAAVTTDAKAEALGKQAMKEVGPCLAMLDLPLEKAAWDSYVEFGCMGKNPLELGKIRKRVWPAKAPGEDYARALDKAQRSGTDVWGESVMLRPEGPTFYGLCDYLEPLQMVNASFRYYPLILSLKEGRNKARCAGNGNQIGVGLKANRTEKTGWFVPDVNVRFFVGKDRERFGDEDARRKGPLPHKGYLPSYHTEYAAGGKTYVQRVTAAGDSPLVVFVQLTVPAGGKLAVLVENQAGAVKVEDGAVRNEAGLILCAARGGTIKRHAEFARFAWIDLEARAAEVLELAIPCEALEKAPALSFKAAMEESEATWEAVLARGAKVEVPEALVNNAWRATLINNFALTRDRGVLCSFGNGNETFMAYEAAETVRAFAYWGYLEDAKTYAEPVVAVEAQGFDRAAQMRLLAELCRLEGDGLYFTGHLELIKSHADAWIKTRRVSPHGLLAENPAAMESQRVYSLDENCAACAALRELGRLAEDLGHKEEGEKYLEEARDFRGDVLKALRGSLNRTNNTHSINPPFIPQYLYSAQKPIPFLPADEAGSRCNVALSRVPDSGLFEPRDPWMDYLKGFLERSGGRMFGNLRSYEPSSLGLGSGLDGVHQTPYDKSLLIRDDGDRFLLAFYGKLAHGMTRETFVGAAVTQVATVKGERGRRLYLAPSAAANAHFLQSLRHMLVLETDEDQDGGADRLDLLRATPREWLAAGKHIALEGLPSAFGPVSARVEVAEDGKTLRADLELPKRRPAAKTLLRLRRPDGLRIAAVTADGANFPFFDAAREELDLSGKTGKIALTVRYSRKATDLASRP